MSDLDARYGRRTPRRWIWPIIALVGISAGVAFAAWVAFQPRPVTAVLLSYDVLSDRQVSITVDVRRSAPIAVACTVYAQADDHTIVGERTVMLPGEKAGKTRLRATVRTERRAVNGVLRGCEPA